MKFKFVALLLSCVLLWSCFEEDEYVNTKRGNFEALWKIMDEHYCFFEYKAVDWNEVHNRYADRISENMSNDALFTVLCEMLAEVKDGHVNLSASHDLGRYWNWYLDYPDNFDSKIIYKKNGAYLGTDYAISGGMHYKILNDNVGYIYYESFSSWVGNLDQILSRFQICDGIIIDVRENGGGYLTNSDKVASRFFNQKTLVGYIQHKTGKGHTDFSEPYATYIEPSNSLRYQKPVVVLTNRHCYSSTNDFVNAMSYAPNATIMGDRTGGGSGLPFSSELPNGWGVRFSASPMTNAEKEDIEFGIEPDIAVEMLESDAAQGKDTLIEEARKLIKVKS